MLSNIDRGSMVHVLSAVARELGTSVVYKQNCKVAVESYKLPLDNTIHIFHYRPGAVDDRLLASLVQDVWDKFCSQRTLMLTRQRHEAEAMWMLQNQQWTERLKDLGEHGVHFSLPSLSMHACAARVTLCVCLTHIFPDTVYTLKGRYQQCYFPYFIMYIYNLTFLTPFLYISLLHSAGFTHQKFPNIHVPKLFYS